jgi:hypothetical protein
VARRERRGRPHARGRRPPRRPGAHRGQLPGQPHVPLPGRGSPPGVRRHPPPRRCGSGSGSSVTGSCPRIRSRRRSSSPTPGSSETRSPCPSSCWGHQPLDTIEALWPRGSPSWPWPGRSCANPTWSTRCERGTAPVALCIHCNKCMPTIYRGTRCVRPARVLSSAVPTDPADLLGGVEGGRSHAGVVGLPAQGAGAERGGDAQPEPEAQNDQVGEHVGDVRTVQTHQMEPITAPPHRQEQPDRHDRLGTPLRQQHPVGDLGHPARAATRGRKATPVFTGLNPSVSCR